MQALQLNGHGEPADVVSLVELPDVGMPGPDEVVIDVEAAPVQPTDLLIINGTYGVQPATPHVLGVEGVGRVTAVGRNVAHLAVGDRTLIPPFTPAWVSRVKTSAPWLRALPDGCVEQLSMLGMNPLTSYVLLTEFVQLQPGDWVVQNAANSSVGRAVIPIAKSLGVKTINVVRRAELVEELTALGADVVLVDGPDLSRRITDATGQTIKLALDGVGGSGTEDLLKAMPLYGNLVVWSGMNGPFTASGPRLLFLGQSIHGFWIYNWLQEQANLDKLVVIFEKLTPLVADGTISTPIAGVFRFDQYLEAFATAAKFSGKAILTPGT
jgi:NADPH:quinone reductase-like Zn-dependent oxidoreductase